MTRDQILQAALALPPGERLAVARELVRSVPEEPEPTRAEWESAWGAEALRRLREIEDGTVEAIPGDEVMARARALLRS